jgi:hypothetical protein
MSFMLDESGSINDGKANSTLDQIRAAATASSQQTTDDPVAGQDGNRSSKTPLLHHDDHEHHQPAPSAVPGRISRTLVNFWLDGLLGLLFVALCVVAVIVQFVFPPGIAARDWVLWGMSYGQWCSVQFGLLALLGLGVLLHVMLHWTWVCCVLSKRILGKSEMPDDGIRTVYGVGLLIGLLLIGAIAVGAAQWMIIQPQ